MEQKLYERLLTAKETWDHRRRKSQADKEAAEQALRDLNIRRDIERIRDLLLDRPSSLCNEITTSITVSTPKEATGVQVKIDRRALGGAGTLRFLQDVAKLLPPIDDVEAGERAEQESAGHARTALLYRIEQLEKVVEMFLSTINAVGGVYTRNGIDGPYAVTVENSEAAPWTDLADAYIEGCKTLSTEAIIDGEPKEVE